MWPDQETTHSYRIGGLAWALPKSWLLDQWHPTGGPILCIGEPNSHDEKCAHVYGKGSTPGKWNDTSCSIDANYLNYAPVVPCQKASSWGYRQTAMRITVPAPVGRDSWLWLQFMAFSLDSIMSCPVILSTYQLPFIVIILFLLFGVQSFYKFYVCQQHICLWHIAAFVSKA